MTNDGTTVGYGFGWYTNVFPHLSAAEREQLLALGADLRHVAHGGGCVAYYNYMIRFLDTRRTVIVLMNGGPIAPRKDHLVRASQARASGHIRLQKSCLALR